MKISAVVITYNEEANIVECLTSLSFVDEIIVMDTGSTDNTVALAKKYATKVISHERVTHVEPVRRAAIEKASYEWILLVDADERIPESLAQLLREHDEAIPVVKIPRKNIIFNQWIKHSGWWPDYVVRFFKKDKVVWHTELHSQPTIQDTIIDLDPREETAIIHYNYQNLTQFLLKMSSYTAVEAEERVRKGEKVAIRHFISEPSEEFMRRFFLLQGYRDGLHGLVLSILQAFSMFIVISRMWEAKGFQDEKEDAILDEFVSESKKIKRDLSYWLLTSVIETTKNPVKRISLKAKRRYSKK